MLKIKPKSPELLQAQVADFASEKLDAREDREETVGLIGKGALAGWVQTNESSHYSEYHRHLIESRRAGAETIQTRTEMLENYKHFASIIGPVEEGDVIGHGNLSAVHVIEDEGKKFAVRTLKQTGDAAVCVEAHLAGAVRARGIPHLEQIVAASYEDGKTVAELMPGERTEDIIAAEVTQIKSHQLEELVETLIALEQNNIAVDLHGKNILYDREAGFGIVDLESAKFFKFRSSLGHMVGQVADVMMRFGQNVGNSIYDTSADALKDKISLLNQFKVQVESRLEGSDLDVALEGIDTRISSINGSINDPSHKHVVQLDVI